MGIVLKLMGNKVLREIVAAVLRWLLSEAAAFTARYLTRAVEIVEVVQATADVPGAEKFRMAGDMLKDELRHQGVAFRDHAIDSVIQAAVGVMKAHSDKAKAAIKE